MIRHKWKVFLALFLVCATALSLLMTGKPVASQEEAPSPWIVRCQKDTGGKCEMFQRLVVQETGQRVAEFAIGFPEGRDSARGVVVLPLGILLTEGVQMQVDEQQPFKFKVRYCTQDGCFAYLNLTDEVLKMMRKGDKAVISFKSLKGQDVNIALSLAGFTKSLEDIS